MAPAGVRARARGALLSGWLLVAACASDPGDAALGDGTSATVTAREGSPAPSTSPTIGPAPDATAEPSPAPSSAQEPPRTTTGPSSPASTTTPPTVTSPATSVGAASPTTAIPATTTSPSPAAASTTAPRQADRFADRPFEVIVPGSYDPATPAPLVIVLHGYTSSGDAQEAYFDVRPLAEEHGFLYVHPEGTRDRFGRQFWNASDACCNFHGSDVDDVAYLTAMIEDIQSRYSVDPKRILLYGHSNGGFMSYRMACERADVIAAVASLAGSTLLDGGRCSPTEPVSVLQIHGTADPVVLYDGGTVFGGAPYPSAAGTVEAWAAEDGCEVALEATGQRRDLEDDLPGDDTIVEAIAGCPTGIGIELWTIEDGGHVPSLADDFSAQVVEFLLAHPKP